MMLSEWMIDFGPAVVMIALTVLGAALGMIGARLYARWR